MELIDHVIAYAQGLPLALEVFGSSLCKKSKDEWVCALNKLKKKSLIRKFRKCFK